MMLYAGLDLGQVQDYSALAILEETRKDGEAQYAVRGLRRWPLGTSYPDIVEAVRVLTSGMTLVVDGTGVGRSVVDQFRLAGQRLVPVSIHGGLETIRDPSTLYWKTPKRELASNINVLLQNRRLTIAPNLQEAETLVHELRHFKAKISASGHVSYGAAAAALPDDWRTGPHDDLVLATALVCWYAERCPKPRVFSSAVGGERGPVSAPKVGQRPAIPGWPSRDTRLFRPDDGSPYR